MNEASDADDGCKRKKNPAVMRGDGPPVYSEAEMRARLKDQRKQMDGMLEKKLREMAVEHNKRLQTIKAGITEMEADEERKRTEREDAHQKVLVERTADFEARIAKAVADGKEKRRRAIQECEEYWRGNVALQKELCQQDYTRQLDAAKAGFETQMNNIKVVAQECLDKRDVMPLLRLFSKSDLRSRVAYEVMHLDEVTANMRNDYTTKAIAIRCEFDTKVLAMRKEHDSRMRALQEKHSKEIAAVVDPVQAQLTTAEIKLREETARHARAFKAMKDEQEKSAAMQKRVEEIERENAVLKREKDAAVLRAQGFQQQWKALDETNRRNLAKHSETVANLTARMPPPAYPTHYQPYGYPPPY